MLSRTTSDSIDLYGLEDGDDQNAQAYPRCRDKPTAYMVRDTTEVLYLQAFTDLPLRPYDKVTKDLIDHDTSLH